MIPSFIARRFRWIWFTGVGTALWINRRDVARWGRFVGRSISNRDQLDLHSWMTEARVRAAITTDPVIRCDPDLDDVVVEGSNVTIHTNSHTGDVAPHLDALRKVKGVAKVWCAPTSLDDALPERNTTSV